MAASPPSRQLDQSADKIAGLDGMSRPTGEAGLSIRLWRANNSGEFEVLSWRSNDPAVSLVLDLVEASGGIVATSTGRFLVAIFSAVQTAILSARRLQWAFQGFSEAGQFAGTSIAVMVHSTEALHDEADLSAQLPLERAIHGQILITSKTAEYLRHLPGLPSNSAMEPGLHELLWQSQSETPTYSSDEETLSEFIRSRGLEHKVPGPMQPPSLNILEPLPGTTDSTSHEVADDLQSVGPDRGHPDSTWLRGRRMFIAAACTVLILLSVVAIRRISHKVTENPEAVARRPISPISGSPQAAGQQSVSPLPKTSPLVHQTAPRESPKTKTLNPASSGLVRRGESAPAPVASANSQDNPQRIPGSKCNFDPNLIPKLLDQAERSRDQGKYDDAERQFRSVLACEPENARARIGLDRVILAKQIAK